MKRRNVPRAGGELGLAWHVIPALWIVVAVAGAFVLVWPARLADPLQPENGAAASSSSVAPQANTNLPVPSHFKESS